MDRSLSGENLVIVPQTALDEMAAEPGDLLYASHTRWWYGGLRSVHVKAGSPGDDAESMKISPEDAATARFTEGQEVVVEKIM